MRKVEPLSQTEIAANLQHLPGWWVQDGKLRAEFRFRSFVEAFAFMTKVALIAEAMQHHPSWTNSYNQVQIELVTHSAGHAITSLDFELANRINVLTH
jgi:4a-hydroxytetrahydrobiopterin dehydratase